MSPTVDESATTRDPRITVHAARSAFLKAIANAIEWDGLPAPQSISFNEHHWPSVDFAMDEDATGDVDDWAAALGVTAADRSTVHPSAGDGPWHAYSTPSVGTGPVWSGYRLRVWCVHHVDPCEF
jgi:hypothetical protein